MIPPQSVWSTTAVPSRARSLTCARRLPARMKIEDTGPNLGLGGDGDVRVEVCHTALQVAHEAAERCAREAGDEPHHDMAVELLPEHARQCLPASSLVDTGEQVAFGEERGDLRQVHVPV